MVLTMAPAGARWGTRIRFGVLVAVALLVAHTAIYAAEDGLGGAFAAAMTAGGHDGWWLPALALTLGAGGFLGGLVLVRLGRLELRARGSRPRRRRGTTSFRSETATIARRLIPAVLALFTLQENLEVLAARGRPLGIDALIGGHPLAVPVLVLVCLGLSLAGALVRLRIATLRRRIGNGPAPARQRPGSARIGAPWRTVGALAPRRWMLDRLDAGRSPPVLLRR
jgi:hypothetical protein